MMLIFTVSIGILMTIIWSWLGTDFTNLNTCPKVQRCYSSSHSTLLHHFSRSADNTVRVFDRRNLTSNGVGSPVYKFEGHRAAVLCVQVSTTCHHLCFFFLFFSFHIICPVNLSPMTLLRYQFSGLLINHLFLGVLQKMVSWTYGIVIGLVQFLTFTFKTILLLSSSPY